MKKNKKESGLISNAGKIAICLALSLLIMYFLSLYNFSNILNFLISICSFALFYFTWRKGFFSFIISILLGLFIFLSIQMSFNISFFLTFIIALVSSLIGLYFYNMKKTDGRFALILMSTFILIWIILSFNTNYPSAWRLENYLVIPFFIILLIISKWFKLSKTSYSLIFVFLTLHIIGAHYTYAEVPFGYWMQSFFGFETNRYDRVVHFLFGFLLAYPVREMFARVANARGIWSLWGPVELVFGLSAIFEIFEWFAAAFYGGDLGIAYLGSQGDIWDAQKDMLLAGLGSMFAMLITALTIFAYRGKDYWTEIKDSFKVNKKVLGERALEKY